MLLGLVFREASPSLFFDMAFPPVCIPDVPFSSFKDISHIALRPQLGPKFNSITVLKALSLNVVTWIRVHPYDLTVSLIISLKVLSPNKVIFWGTRDGTSTCEFWSDTIQPIIVPYFEGHSSKEYNRRTWRACLWREPHEGNHSFVPTN